MDYGRINGAYDAWTDVQADLDPQPMLTDIEFNADTFMVLGFSDRIGHRVADDQSLFPDGTLVGITRETKGEILIAGYNNTNGFVLEAAGVIEDRVGQFANNNGDGPGYLNPDGSYPPAWMSSGEFFEDDWLEFNSTLGGLALRKDIDMTVSTIADPFGVQSGGLTYFDNLDGSRDGRVELYAGAIPNSPFLGKSAGLGDIELMPEAPPIQIGNYVWDDTDGDGIQDPGEAGLDGVTMELYDAAGALLASTMTANGGQYYFSDTDGLDYYSTYYVVFGGSGSATTANSGAGSITDMNDSDAFVAGGTEPAGLSGSVVVRVDTGGSAETNHTFDIGIGAPPACSGADNGTTTLFKQ